MREINLSVVEVYNQPKDPPKKVFWDWLPARLVFFLRRFFDIRPTPLETWQVAKAVRLVLETLEARQNAKAVQLVDGALRNAKPPTDPSKWN